MDLIDNCLCILKLKFQCSTGRSSFNVANRYTINIILLFYGYKFVFFFDAHHLNFNNNFTFIIHNKLLDFRL